MRVKIKEAAKLLDIPEQTLRVGLQRGLFPFGEAVKQSERYTYYINRKRLERWIGGEDNGKSDDSGSLV